MFQLQTLNGEFIEGVDLCAERISKIPGVRRVSACDISKQTQVGPENSNKAALEILRITTGFLVLLSGKEHVQKVLISVEREHDLDPVELEIRALSHPISATP